MALLRHLLDRGCPLDAVGIQAHLQLRRPFEAEPFARFVGEIRDMGLAVLITELDIREADALPEPTWPARDAAVAARTGEFVAAARGCGLPHRPHLGPQRPRFLVGARRPGVARPDGVATRGLPYR